MLIFYFIGSINSKKFLYSFNSVMIGYFCYISWFNTKYFSS